MAPTISLGQINPFKNFDFSQSVGLLTLFISVIVLLVLIGVFFVWYLLQKRWKYRIVIFQKVGKTIEDVGKDRAMFTRIGAGGDRIMKLKKNKQILPIPKIQTGRNKYWYYIREDQEWINFGIEDIDTVMKLMGVNFLDKEMRHARASIQKILQDRYQKVTWWDKHGAFLIYVILIVIISVAVWFLFDKYIEILDKAQLAIDAAAKVNEETARILGALDNIKSYVGLKAA